MRYFNNAIFIAIIIAVVVKLSTGGELSLPWESEANAGTYPPGITALSSGELAKKLLGPSEKPTFLFIYASWCPYCKRQFPEVEKLTEKYHGNVNFLALSIDKTPQVLAAFLNSRPASKNFTAYFHSSRDTRVLVQKMSHMGANFTGGIPFMALFDGNGKLLSQFGGLTDTEILNEAIKKSF